MEAEGLKPKDLAPELNKEVQTIFNWKSKGVPKAQWVACEAVMERHHARNTGAPGGEDPVFVIKPSYEQFQNWNRAALDAGKLIEDWAMDGLDAIAEEMAARALAVAEEKAVYPTERL